MQVFSGRSKIDVRLEMVAEDRLSRNIGRNGRSTTKQQRYCGWRSHHIDSLPLSILQLLLSTSQPAGPWTIALFNALSEWEADHQDQKTQSLTRSFSL